MPVTAACLLKPSTATSSGTADHSGRPMPTTPTFAIVGAGLAGAKAAEALRAEGFDGRLVLLGEPSGPTTAATVQDVPARRGRPGLALPPRRVLLRRSQHRAVHLGPGPLHRSARPPAPARLRRAHRLPAAAAGHRRRTAPTAPPGADLDGIYHLRNRRDADRLVAAVGAPRVVVVGTGWIGCEVAASVRQLGRDVTLVGSEAVPLARVLGPEIGCFYRDLHAEQGVRLALGTDIDAFRGDGRVEAVVTSDGRTLLRSGAGRHRRHPADRAGRGGRDRRRGRRAGR